MVTETKSGTGFKAGFKAGDRVRWSAAFLAEGKAIDPKWFARQVSARGIVDRVTESGFALVYWDGSHETCLHPLDRIELAETETFETWEKVLAHIALGAPVYYKAPLDRRAARVSCKVKGQKVRIAAPSADCDPFTADSGHLSRFQRTA